MAGITLSSVVTLLGFVGAIVLTLGRALWLIARIEKQVEQLEADVRKHFESTQLHRNPDSEDRWKRLEEAIDSLSRMVSDIRVELGRRKQGEPS